MKVSLSRLRRLGSAGLELALGVFAVALLIAAFHPGEARASTAAATTSVAAQLPASGTACLVDDSNGNRLTINLTTGEYSFQNCTNGFTLTGTGIVTIKGCTVSLKHVAPDRRVLATIDYCGNKGNASAQTFIPTGPIRTIVDRSTLNDNCLCEVEAPPQQPSKKKKG